MKILKRWSVLDPRLHPSEAYMLMIVRRRDNSIAMIKRGIDKRTVTLYANPNATLRIVLDFTLSHIRHIRSYSCVVIRIRRAKKT